MATTVAAPTAIPSSSGAVTPTNGLAIHPPSSASSSSDRKAQPPTPTRRTYDCPPTLPSMSFCAFVVVCCLIHYIDEQ
jgi:hypothetical protein